MNSAKLCALASLLLLLATGSASAHARLIKSAPANKAALTNAPVLIELWFNELLDDGFNAIEVFPLTELNQTKRQNLARGVPQVDPKDRTHLTIELGALTPGSYLISYRVLSRDGHTAPGRLSFFLGDAK